MYKEFDYIIVGAGIAGCSLAYFLSKHSSSVLLIDKNSQIANGASGAAGAFLSPLLGKPNSFKDLITSALKFSTKIYKDEFSEYITNCGTCRIPKNENDKEKFQSYKPFMDFDYKEFEEGFLFDIGSVVDSYNICKNLAKDVETLFNYKVNSIADNIINNELKAKKLFLTTGADISLISEDYLNIRAVWGQRINIKTSTKIDVNYHKECSLSNSNNNIVSIGATHHRFEEDMTDSSYNLDKKDINLISHNDKTKKIIDEDTNNLLKLANDIKKLENVELLDVKIGARASSVDYFPIVGRLVDSKSSFDKFPHLINGSFIKDENLIMHENLYVLNGVGGRGFVLSLYLANLLVESIINKKELPFSLTTHRMFKRWAKRLKNRNK